MEVLDHVLNALGIILDVAVGILSIITLCRIFPKTKD